LLFFKIKNMAGLNRDQGGVDQLKRGFLKGIAAVGATKIVGLSTAAAALTACGGGGGGGGGTTETPDNRPSLNASLNTATSATWLEAGGVSIYKIQLPLSASLSPVAILSCIPV
jgi:hypothetical protein